MKQQGLGWFRSINFHWKRKGAPACSWYKAAPNEGFLKWGYPQIFHLNRLFQYTPSTLGYPCCWKPPKWEDLVTTQQAPRDLPRLPGGKLLERSTPPCEWVPDMGKYHRTYRGFHQWGIPKMDGFWGKIANKNGWWLGPPLWLRKPPYV